MTSIQRGAIPKAEIAERVKAFYEAWSFPGYEEYQTPFDLLEKAREGIYARMLDDQLPFGARILDVGCGTGQLVAFLAMTRKEVVGADFSFNSLKQGQRFKEKFGLRGARFLQMDLFAPALRPESFDYVFCAGVLHHTADAARGFATLCGLVRRGGYVVIGLYNRYARLPLDLRRLIFRALGDRFVWLDFVMRQRSVGPQKKKIWFMDQYRNPYERKFTVADVLGWFRQNGVEYVNSVPKINLAQRLTAGERLFEPHDPGTRFDHVARQLGWIWSRSGEGGFFLIIGRKQ